MTAIMLYGKDVCNIERILSKTAVFSAIFLILYT